VSPHDDYGTYLSRRVRRAWLPMLPRIGVILAALLSATGVIAMGTVHPVTPSPAPIDQIMTASPYVTLVRQHIMHDVNVSRRACGFTLTIQRIYADGNKIVVGYIITDPADHIFFDGAASDPTKATFPVASDASGTKLWYLGGGVSSDRRSHVTGAVAVFDAGLVAGPPKILALHLVFPVINTVEQLNNSHWQLPQCATMSPFEPQAAPRGVDYTRLRRLTIHGPFTFDIMVPVAPGYRFNLHQTSLAKGLALTLERVVLSPLETRIYIHGMPLGMEERSSATLFIDGKEIGGGGEEISELVSSTGSTVYNFSPLLPHGPRGHEKWVVIVHVVHAVPFFPATPPKSALNSSSWAFNFTLSYLIIKI